MLGRLDVGVGQQQRICLESLTMNQICDPIAHFNRRSLLGGGLRAAGGTLLMTQIARSLAAAESNGQTDPSRPKNVILLWLEGGPSQLETFDPHPGGMIGGDTQAISTSVPGLEIADTLPATAEVMHLASLVRSVTSVEGDHARAIYNVKTGFSLDPTLRHPALGSVVCHHEDEARVAAGESPVAIDIPRHISIVPGNAPAQGGYLGAKYDAFQIGDPRQPVPDIRSSVDAERFSDRVDDLYNVVEKEFRRGRMPNLDDQRTLHREMIDAARRMMSSEQLDAFDVSEEPQSELDRFGDSPFGRGVLAASRLIEAGARCVEVTLGGWDSHVTNGLLQSNACEKLDPALAGLLKRLEERDQLDSTLVVCGGEFGRTPQINPAEGRDHYPHGFSILLAGGGIRRGGVVGETSADPDLKAKDPLVNVTDPVKVEDIHATVMHALGIDFAHELDTPVGRPLKRSEGKVIASLLA